MEDFNQTPKQAATLRELQRRANDRIRVYNPTGEDFTVYWDQMGFIVPAKDKDNGQGQGQAVVPRYVADNYFKHMSDKILGEERLKEIEQENKKRTATGQSVMNHYEDRVKFESQIRVAMPDRLRRLHDILILGVEEKYGSNPVDEFTPRPDNTSIYDELGKVDRPARKPEEVSLPVELPHQSVNDEDIINDVAQ